MLWRKTLGSACSVITTDDDRLMQIDVNVDNQIMKFVNLYLPYDNGTNLDEYQMYLNKVDSMLSSNPYSCALGDYNANIRSDSSRFGQKLTQFCVDDSLIISDKVLAFDDITFVSDAHAGSVAWLDRVISTRRMHSLIDSIWIDYSYISSDHLPLCVKLNINKMNLVPRDSSSHAQSHLLSPIRWDSLSDEMLEQ